MKYPAPYVHIRLYNAWVIGLLGWDIEEAKKFTQKQFGTTLEFGTSDGLTFALTKDRDLICIIHTKKFNSTPPYLALLVHECLHATIEILRNVGQPIGDGPSEYATYLLQDIFQGLLTQQKEVKR